VLAECVLTGLTQYNNTDTRATLYRVQWLRLEDTTVSECLLLSILF